MHTPTSSAMPMSRGRTMKPYCSARQTTFRRAWSAQQASVQAGAFDSLRFLPWFGWANSITSSPPSSPVARAATGRNTANTVPSRA